MSARLVLAAAVMLAAGSAHAQPSQDGGLHVETVSSPSPGSVQVLISADAKPDAAIGNAPAAKDFTLWLGSGAAPGVSVARNGGRGALTTVVLLDESASYKLGEGAKVAVPAISAYAKDAGRDELALVAFSLDTTAFPVRVGPQAFLADLVAKRKPGQATSVTIGLAAAIKLATVEGAPGLREVIVFTDAGDEAEVDRAVWAKIIAQARDAGVRVSVVLPTDDKKPTGTKHEAWVTTTTSLNRLATETAGTFVTSNDAAAVAKALADARGRIKSWLVLEAKLCGARSGQPVDVRVEYVPRAKREAWSAGAKLDAAAWAPGADAACPSLCKAACDPWTECIAGECQARSCTSDAACAGGAACLGGVCAKRCTQACAAWEDCAGGACVARACKSDEACGVGASCKSGACQQRAQKSRALIYLLGGAGALLLLAALLVLLRKKPVPLVAVEEPVAMPAEPVALESAPVDLDPLPETHLVAIGGWATPGERWRLHKRKTIAGGEAGADLVFAVDQISSRHAQFELFPSGDLWISDVGSTNGTFVNGRRLAAKERAKLVVGDQVKLSQNLTLVVERPGEAAKPRVEPPGRKAKQKTTFDPGNR